MEFTIGYVQGGARTWCSILLSARDRGLRTRKLWGLGFGVIGFGVRMREGLG